MLSKNQLGFLYMFLSVCAFSIMDLIVKWSDNYPLGQVIFFRGFFGIVLYYFVIPKERDDKLSDNAFNSKSSETVLSETL